MKILFCPCHYVYDGKSEGSEFSWAFNIAHRIASNNKSSIVVTGHNRYLDSVNYKIIETQKTNNGIDLSLASAIRFNLAYSKILRRNLKHGSFDIVHHILPFAIDTTFNLPMLWHKKTAFVIGPIQNPLHYKDDDVNSRDIRNHEPPKRQFNGQLIYQSLYPVAKYLSSRTLFRANKIIVINEHTYELLLRRGVPHQKMVIIPPGIDTNKFRAKLHYPQKITIFELITVGFLIKRKGVDIILSALAEIVKIHRNFRLRIVGDGPQKRSLIQMTKKLGLDKYVTFQGFVSYNDIPQYYQKAHIFINMSRSEGFATVCLEAMASGLTVISSRVGGFADVIEDGVTGYLIEPENDKLLAQRLIYLFNHRKLISVLGQNARAQAEKEYDWEKVIVPRYIDMYDSLIYEK